MLRFPNPSSAIRNFVSVYRVAYQELVGRVVGIDDIVGAVVGHDLATSTGHFGDEAIARSTRKDRSRDPLFNQIKMYAELFRSLGWLQPTQQAALRYTFTPLGGQVVVSGQHHAEIVGESALGIAYPSHTLHGQRGDYNVRPFCFLLRTMLECNGLLSRDEMIVGPLSAKTDRLPGSFGEVCARIVAIRAGEYRVDAALAAVSCERGVKINTLKNYTRWPIALMRDVGWTEKRRARLVKKGRPIYVYALTTAGEKVAKRVAASTDLRADRVSVLNGDEVRSLSLFAHYRMLQRSGFDVSSVGHFLDRGEPTLARAMDTLSIRARSDILYSPLQSLPISEIQRIFGGYGPDGWVPPAGQSVREGVTPGTRRSPPTRLLRFSRGGQAQSIGESVPEDLVDELKSAYDRSHSADEAAEQFVRKHRRDSKTEFYPLIRDIFRLLGLSCQVSRTGANYQRWDALLRVRDLAIPIEIKSPTEEEFISTKALRQAVENKIVLLARQSIKVSRKTTSLIVGYRFPNNRSDMSSLIEDVFHTYGICVGVIDLHTLALASVRSLCENKRADMDAIGQLSGFLHA